ncbi:MAG TPA: condensation domain-containing protein, partial [Gemmatimonadales bacterium]|nr:condensation domain-containing protein [Gemmatimonadales bacterium]
MMPDADEYEFPVSPAQSRLLVLDRMNHGTAQYNVYAAFAVRGGFDAEAFGCALDAVVARHEALRTVFRTAGAEQVQVVRASARAEVRSVSGVPA